MVDLNGQIIGVHRGGLLTAAGVGYAISSDLITGFLKDAAKQKETQLSAFGQNHPPAYQPPQHTNEQTVANILARKRYVGLTMLSLSPRLIEDLNECNGIRLTNVISGIIIINVAPGSPSQLAGLKENDVIVSINETSVDTVSSFYTILNSNHEFSRTILRNGNELNTNVKSTVMQIESPPAPDSKAETLDTELVKLDNVQKLAFTSQ